MIKSVEIKNFKAINKAKVRLTPLTAFIGYNGTGKSSILEALETFQAIVANGLDKAMQPWRLFEHVHYKGKKKQRWFSKNEISFKYAPMEFSFNVKLSTKRTPLVPMKFSSSIAEDVKNNGRIYFIEEKVSYKQFERRRDENNQYITQEGEAQWDYPDQSILVAERETRRFIESWQFLSMNTFLMGNPHPQKKTGGKTTLNKDGSNLAEYVLSVRDANPEVFQGIIEAIQYVLPYALDIQPAITQELENRVYMQLSEQDFKLPGWLLSTGTLKILALLSVFRNPDPAPLIAIEEIENGLDPRSINLIVNEIRDFVKGKKSQVIITTHSPYLLDLLHLSQVVFVERKGGKVIFNRPYDFEQLRNWSKEYTPGEMYRKDLIQQIIK